jgi:hypothetical protein
MYEISGPGVTKLTKSEIPQKEYNSSKATNPVSCNRRVALLIPFFTKGIVAVKPMFAMWS